MCDPCTCDPRLALRMPQVSILDTKLSRKVYILIELFEITKLNYVRYKNFIKERISKKQKLTV